MTTKADILRAIRQKCLDCSCYQPSEVRDCKLITCDLWPYRLGRDPEPGIARGCAKPSLPRSTFDDERAGPVPGTGHAPPPPESLLPRDGFDEGEAIPMATPNSPTVIHGRPIISVKA
jgi:hypothetical protein